MNPTEQQPRPEIGDYLIVIHDFQARSSDELSLAKGERVELIERDDEFGDGWFLGKHVVSGNMGLFPQVYTRAIPETLSTTTLLNSPDAIILAPVPVPELAIPTLEQPSDPAVNAGSYEYALQLAPADELPDMATLAVTPIGSLTPIGSMTPAASMNPTASMFPTSSIISTSPMAPAATMAFAASTVPDLSSSKVLSMPASVPVPFGNRAISPDSQVLHETLNVIDEHITDFRSNPADGSQTAPTTDSGSDYSANGERRMSYIAGEETDDEGDIIHSRTQVENWSCEEVAEYLFTVGVEKRHCEVFQDQEISGDVLLGLDQTSIFIPAFDLGSVGRRLKTWLRIKALQDEINGVGSSTRRTTQTYGSETGQDDEKQSRSRASTLTRSESRVEGSRISSSQIPRIDAMMYHTPVSSRTSDGPARSSHTKRPSAASVRDLHYSRRHSSTDYRLTGTTMAGSSTPKYSSPKFAPSTLTSTAPPILTSTAPPNFTSTAPSTLTSTTHNRQPSFDRNWTPSVGMARPLSSAGLQAIPSEADADTSDPNVDPDRGYSSGIDLDGRKRNVLKRVESRKHSRTSSYADEQRVRNGTMTSRHSRYSSYDSREVTASLAAQKYYGMQLGSHHKRASSNLTTDSGRLGLPAVAGQPLAVAKADGPNSNQEPTNSPVSPTNRQGIHADWLSAVTKPAINIGPVARAMSATVVPDRSKISTSTDSVSKDSPVQSPARTGSTTPSGGPSFELDSPDATKSPSTVTTTTSKSSRKKGKKDTSAYTRGLLNIRPIDAMKEADYSGWMRKKSSTLMMSWKPRLFVLKGRRLAYYYSEDDDQEQGLIDISFHRVLPADNEKLTGLHATITGAGASPGPHLLPTMADASAGSEKTSDSIFIFKLLPPRSGLSRAVNFTRPMVHYFAVPNVTQGRLWMAALMKATIERDDTQPITTTYQQKTISLAKARVLRHRPPALMIDEPLDDAARQQVAKSSNKESNILGITFSEADSGVSGFDLLGADSPHAQFLSVGPDRDGALAPKTA